MKIFGTDGVRELATYFNEEFLTAFAKAVACCGGLKRVAVGRDPRPSGADISRVLCRKLTEYGLDVTDLSVVPTPVVAFYVAAHGLDLGLVVSASHNPPEYNGIKLFVRGGEKPSADFEEELERLIVEGCDISARSGSYRVTDCSAEFCEFVENNFARLDGLKIAVDCANGATVGLAKKSLQALGADVTEFCCATDGYSINNGCGATDIKYLQNAVKNGEFDIGFAYDGDGDRVITVRDGIVYDGDWEIVALAAAGYADEDGVVGTVMTNTACENCLKGYGVRLLRTAVGDKYVHAEMNRSGAKIGGEKAGHIILSDYSATGDGILVSACLAAASRSPWPIPCDFPEATAVVKADTNAKQIFEKSREIAAEIVAIKSVCTRVVVRASGTEPKIRITVEAETREVAEAAVAKLKSVVERVVCA